MAFSLIARCPRTNHIGAVSCAASMAAGARVIHCAAGVGAVVTQSRSDAQLGARGLALLAAGLGAPAAMEAMVASTPHGQWRQIAVLDAAGNTAVFSGARTAPEMSEAPAQDACAIGAGLTSTLVPPAMLQALLVDPTLPLAERLMLALEEGQAAGGNHAPAQSAFLRVMVQRDLPLVDLRVDWDPAPIAALRALWNRFAPLANDLLLRAIDPENPAIRS
ncbi:MAG: DUF1028 domain-containing protein [Acetobacteraceae bacterium]